MKAHHLLYVQDQQRSTRLDSAVRPGDEAAYSQDPDGDLLAFARPLPC